MGRFKKIIIIKLGLKNKPVLKNQVQKMNIIKKYRDHNDQKVFLSSFFLNFNPEKMQIFIIYNPN